jgi:hypothetical protein
MSHKLPFAVITVLALSSCRDEELGGLSGGVAGQVCNPLTGRAAPGAVVTARFLDPVTKKDEEKSATADDAGFFQMGGLPADVDVSLHVELADEFQNDIPAFPIVAGEDAQLRDPGCRDAPAEPGVGELIGQICNRHTGDYVTEGTVTVLLADGSELVEPLDETGSFIMTDVPAGVHVVYVQAPGFQKTYQVTIVEKEQTQLEDQVVDCQPYDELTTGMIVGKVCGSAVAGEPGGPLSGAVVRIVGEIDGAVFEDETLPDGSFTIAGIPTPQSGLQVEASKGGFNFIWDNVDVFSIADNPDGTNLTAESGCQPLVPDDERRYLVVKGMFDRIEQSLARMNLANVVKMEGVPADPSQLWTTEAFGNFDELAEYDAVFVNCGVNETDFVLGLSPAIKANLKRYVQEGGSLYVSDWAYDLIEQVWPENFNFLGDDTVSSAAEHGEDGTYTMDVLEPGLAEYEGADQVDIEFRFGSFALVSQVAQGVTTYLRGDVGYRVNGGVSTLPETPITVGFSDGLGRVIFTSFHQESNLADECTSDGDCDGGFSCLEGYCGEELLTDGPEDLALRYLIFSL